MNVPFYDHAKIYRRRQAEIDAAIHRVLASGRPDWGDEVPAFEAANRVNAYGTYLLMERESLRK